MGGRLKGDSKVEANLSRLSNKAIKLYTY